MGAISAIKWSFKATSEAKAANGCCGTLLLFLCQVYLFIFFKYHVKNDIICLLKIDKIKIKKKIKKKKF